MLLAELQRQAEKVLDIPESYRLIIREPYTHDDGGALFVWEHEEELGRIAINVDVDGKLTRISVDREKAKTDAPAFEHNQLYKIAEDFFVTHYPDALDVFEFHRSEIIKKGIRFYFGQIAGGLPLDRTGCFVDVSLSGEVLIFMYLGAKKLPAWPSAIVSKERLMEDARNRVKLSLKLMYLSSDIYDVEESGPRLVYEISPPYLGYKADEMHPELLFEVEEELPVILETHSVGHSAVANPTPFLGQLVGIDDNMHLIRESESELETVKVWRSRDFKNEVPDLALTGFIHNHSKDTVKTSISKKDGTLIGVIWFLEREGNQTLSRRDCYQISVDFLRSVMTEQVDRLYCIVEENENEHTSLETFNYKIRHRQLELGNETITVTVNRSVGKIEYYGGPSFELSLLDEVSTIPTVEIEQAYKIYWSLLDFRLAWTEWDDPEEFLIYENFKRMNGKAIHFIDAQNGKAIGER